MTKNVLAYLKKVVNAEYIKCEREETCVGGSIYYITYISQDYRTYQAIINAEDVGQTLYENYSDLFSELKPRQYGPLNLSKKLEFVELKH